MSESTSSPPMQIISQPTNILSIFNNIPFIPKVLATILVGFYLVGFAIDKIIPPWTEKIYGMDVLTFQSVQLLTLIPANVIWSHFYVWTFFTAGFFESRFVSMLFAVVVVLVVGKWMASLNWKNAEFVRFFLFVNLLTTISTFLIVISYARLVSPSSFRLEIGGFSAVIAAFTVVAKLEIPENTIQIFVIPAQAKFLPLVTIGISLVFSILFRNLSLFFFSLFGVFYGWMYLRFYLVKEGGVGSPSEDFTFASLFPFAAQPFINLIATPIHKVVSMTGLLTLRGQSTTTIIAPGGHVLGSTLPRAPLSDDAKRRIEAGNKAIDDLLSGKEVSIPISDEK